MDTYVISIKPEFANKILNGEKKVEFRKVIPKNSAGSYFFVYSSSPEKKVICAFRCTRIIVDKDKEKVWNKTKAHAGITKEYFNEYFKDKNYACALVIGDVMPTLLGEMEKLSYYYINTPPQNYAIAFKGLEKELRDNIIRSLV